MSIHEMIQKSKPIQRVHDVCQLRKAKRRRERSEPKAIWKESRKSRPRHDANSTVRSQKSEAKKKHPKKNFTDKKKRPSTGIDMNYLNPIVVNLRGVVRSLLHSQLKTNG